MIPEFTQAIFLRSLDEWGACPSRFNALPLERQTAYLKRQGFASLHDILAHVGVWWEEARAIIEDTLNKVDRPSRKYDFDEFNAASLARFKDTPEPEFMQWYEAERQRMIALVSSLDAEQIKIRRVYGWLDAVTLLHLKEHGVGAPRFLVIDMLQREWVAYPEQFHELKEEEQNAFLQKQGFARFGDILAHVAAWWDYGLKLINAVSADPAYRPPDVDVEALNADVLELFGALPETEVLKQYATARETLIEVAMNLSDELYAHPEVQSWLKADVIEHYFDHAV